MKTKFQTWWQWVNGCFTCPKCLVTWNSVMAFNNCELWDGLKSKYRTSCYNCGDLE